MGKKKSRGKKAITAKKAPIEPVKHVHPKERVAGWRYEQNNVAVEWNFPKWIPLSVLAVGVTIRIIYLFQNMSNPFFFDPVLDAANYDRWALAIAEGKGVQDAVFTANPFYPYLLSVIYRFFPRDLILVRGLQILVGTTSCVLIYLTSSRVFGRATGLVALVLSVLYGPLISFEGELLAEVWTVALISASLYFLARATPADRHCIAMLLLSGLTMGLAAIGRPNILLFAPFAMGWVAWIFRDKGKAAFVTRVMALGIGIMIAIAPVTTRNYLKGGEFVLLTAHGGINFFIGNNEKANGWFKIAPDFGLKGGQESLIESATRIAEENYRRKLKASEVSGYWLNRGLQFIEKHPVLYLGLLIKKLFYSWNAYEKPGVSNYYFNKEHSSVLRTMTLGFGFLGPFSLIGMALAFSMRRNIGWLYIFIVSYFLSLMIFFVSSRYRLPVIPALIGFAGFGVLGIARIILERSYSRTASYVTMLLVVAAVVNYPVSGKKEDMAYVYYNLGGTFKNSGRYSEAIHAYKTAISINPRFAKTYLKLGLAYRKLGKNEEAEKAYLQAVKISPNYAVAYYNLGNAYASLGRVDDAIASYKEAIRLNPSFTQSYYQLASQYRKKGLIQEGQKILESLSSRAKEKLD